MTSSQTQQNALLDELLKGCGNPQDILGEHGLIKQLTKRLVERVLDAELTSHLGYEPHSKEGHGSGSSRNGKTSKTVKDKTGEFEIEVPRDRIGSFTPELIKKGQRRFNGFDDKIIWLYGSGQTAREIQRQLEELYGVKVSPTLISEITDAVLDDVKAWRSRPLSSVYPILYFDALVVKSRQDGAVKNKSVYLALGINMEGEKELLGLWLSENEGAKFWLNIFNGLKNRGAQDCFIACVDGLKGLPDAIEAAFPNAQVQLCIVHKVRNSLKYVPWKERKEAAADLRAIYSASTVSDAEQALDRFAERWDAKYPAISPSRRADWSKLTVFLDYSPEIRKAVYTTNAIESLNYSMRKVLKKRGAFPNDESIMKIMYLALNNISKKWNRPIWNWKTALNQFVIMFGERVPK